MSITCALRFAAGFVVANFTLLCCAQQSTPGSSPDPSAQTQPSAQQNAPQQAPTDKNSPDTSKEHQDAGQDNPSATSKDRLFFALPNFLTVQNAGHIPPLTSKQKFGVVARGAFDYIQIPWYAFLSGLSQAEDSEPGFGQGWEGYGKRFGSAAADGTIENFMVGAILPSIFHQDPRFFQSGKGGFLRRTGYAVTRIVVTRGDSGHPQFNISEVLGSAMSASISTFSYHPRSTVLSTPSGPRFIPSDRTLDNTASVWASQLGYDTITIVIKEFWPDIHRKLSHKPKGEMAGPARSNP